MKLEIYQIIVPIISLLIIFSLGYRVRSSQSTWQEATIGILFWLGVGLFSIFPDYFSNILADLFGIKSNVNAIIFFCLGLIFFFQFKLFFMLKKQQIELTELNRQIALERFEREQQA